MKLIKVLSVVIGITVLSGCAVGNDPTFHYTRAISIGQELIDLQKAKESKTITELSLRKLSKRS